MGGNDTLYGLLNEDALHAGEGSDKLYGGAGNDALLGENGNDLLAGGGDQDRLYGGTGNDKVFGDAGMDRLYGGDGADLLEGGLSRDTLYGGDGDDTLSGEEYDDYLSGHAGSNVYYGGLGNDVFVFGNSRGSGELDVAHVIPDNDKYVLKEGANAYVKITVQEFGVWSDSIVWADGSTSKRNLDVLRFNYEPLNHSEPFVMVDATVRSDSGAQIRFSGLLGIDEKWPTPKGSPQEIAFREKLEPRILSEFMAYDNNDYL